MGQFSSKWLGSGGKMIQCFQIKAPCICRLEEALSLSIYVVIRGVKGRFLSAKKGKWLREKHVSCAIFLQGGDCSRSTICLSSIILRLSDNLLLQDQFYPYELYAGIEKFVNILLIKLMIGQKIANYQAQLKRLLGWCSSVP